MRKFCRRGILILSAALSCTAFAQDDTPHYNSVNLQANASRQVPNDQMQVMLYIEKNNKQPSILSTEVTQAINQAFATARAYPQVKTTTGTQSTQPIYDDKNKIKEWRSRAELRLEGTDFKAVSELISKLHNNFQTENIQFSVSDNVRLKVENELIIEASKQFQQRADTLAKVWSKSSYQLLKLNINTNSNIYAQPYLSANLMMKSSTETPNAPVQEISVGETKFNVTAEGSIQLK